MMIGTIAIIKLISVGYTLNETLLACKCLRRKM